MERWDTVPTLQYSWQAAIFSFENRFFAIYFGAFVFVDIDSNEEFFEINYDRITWIRVLRAPPGFPIAEGSIRRIEGRAC
jgi:hypothetical protein